MKFFKLLITSVIMILSMSVFGQTISATDSRGITVQIDINTIFYSIKSPSPSGSILIIADKSETFFTSSNHYSVQTLGCNKFYSFTLAKRSGSLAVGDSILLNVKFAQVQQSASGTAVLTTTLKGITYYAQQTYSAIIAQTNTNCSTSATVNVDNATIKSNAGVLSADTVPTKGVPSSKLATGFDVQKATEITALTANPLSSIVSAMKVGDKIELASTDSATYTKIKNAYLKTDYIKAARFPAQFETLNAVIYDYSNAKLNNGGLIFKFDTKVSKWVLDEGQYVAKASFPTLGGFNTLITSIIDNSDSSVWVVKKISGNVNAYVRTTTIDSSVTPTVSFQISSNTFWQGDAIWNKAINTGNEKEAYNSSSSKWLPVNNVTFNTIAEMSAYTGNAEQVIVTDSLRGGVFKKRTLTGNAVDNGIVFSSAVAGCVFVRDYEGKINVTWYNILPDDGIDDNVLLTSLFSKKGDYYFNKSGIYNTSAQIDITSDNVSIDAVAGTELKSGVTGNTYNILYATNKKNIVISNLKLNGNKPNNTQINNKQLIFFTSCYNSRIEKIEAINGVNDGIVIEYGKNNKIANCYVSKCNKLGIYGSGTDSLIIENNLVDSCLGVSGIGLLSSWGCDVRGNTSRSTFTGGAWQGYGFSIGRDARYNNISNNTFDGLFNTLEPIGGTLHGITYDGVTQYGCTNNVFSGNTFLRKVSFITKCDSLYFLNNIIKIPSFFGEVALRVDNPTISRSLIKGNTIIGGGTAGEPFAMQFANTDGITIEGNNIQSAATVYAAVINAGQLNNVFINNNVTGVVGALLFPLGTWKVVRGNYLNNAQWVEQSTVTTTTTTLNTTVEKVFVNPAAALATETITLNSTPLRGDFISVRFGGTIAAGAIVVTGATTFVGTTYGDVIPIGVKGGDEIQLYYDGSAWKIKYIPYYIAPYSATVITSANIIATAAQTAFTFVVSGVDATTVNTTRFEVYRNGILAQAGAGNDYTIGTVTSTNIPITWIGTTVAVNDKFYLKIR